MLKVSFPMWVHGLEVLVLRVGGLRFRGSGVPGSGTMRQHPPLFFKVSVTRMNSIWQMIWK